MARLWLCFPKTTYDRNQFIRCLNLEIFLFLILRFLAVLWRFLAGFCDVRLKYCLVHCLNHNFKAFFRCFDF